MAAALPPAPPPAALRKPPPSAFLSFVEIAAGVGGGGIGATRAGIPHAASLEICKTKCGVLAQVFGEESVACIDAASDVAQGRANRGFLSIRILGPPCQDNAPTNVRKKSGARLALAEPLFKTAMAGGPYFIILEQLPSFASTEECRNILRMAEQAKYTVTKYVLHAYNYGLPSERKRMFLLFERWVPTAGPNGKALRASDYMDAIVKERRKHKTTLSDWWPDYERFWIPRSADLYKEAPLIVTGDRCFMSLTGKAVARQAPTWGEYSGNTHPLKRRSTDVRTNKGQFEAMKIMSRVDLMRMQGMPGDYPLTKPGEHCRCTTECTRITVWNDQGAQQLANAIPAPFTEALCIAIRHAMDKTHTPSELAKVWSPTVCRVSPDPSRLAVLHRHVWRKQDAWTPSGHFGSVECGPSCHCCRTLGSKTESGGCDVCAATKLDKAVTLRAQMDEARYRANHWSKMVEQWESQRQHEVKGVDACAIHASVLGVHSLNKQGLDEFDYLPVAETSPDDLLARQQSHRRAANSLWVAKTEENFRKAFDWCKQLDVRLSQIECAAYLKQRGSKPAAKKYSLDDVHRDNSHMTPKQINRVDGLLNHYWTKTELFVRDSEQLPRVFHDRHGKPVTIDYNFSVDAQPSRVKCPRFKPGAPKTVILEEIAKEGLRSGLFVFNDRSEWAMRPMLVGKFSQDADRAGVPTAIRFCGDFPPLNDKLDKVVPKSPHIEDEVSKLEGMKFFISLDASGQYHSFVLSDEARDASAVWMPVNGRAHLLSYTRMAMGAKNSGAYAQTYFNKMFTYSLPPQYQRNVVTSADDITLCAHTIDELLDVLEAVLLVLEKHKVCLKPSKLHLVETSVVFWGKRYSGTDVRPAERNLNPAERMRDPTNIHELKSLLGYLVQWAAFLGPPSTVKNPDARLREALEGYKIKVRPLTSLLSSKTDQRSFAERWTEEHSELVQHFRERLLSGVHIQLPLRDRGFTLITDSSRLGWGAMLVQTDDNGQRRLVAHWSAPHKGYSTSAPAFYNEGCSLLNAFELAYPIVCSSKETLVIMTDALSMTWLQNTSGKAGLSPWRWVKLQEVPHVIRYLKGPRNPADCLSRPPLLGPHVFAAGGLPQMLDTLLLHLPEKLRECKKPWLGCEQSDDAPYLARQIQSWRKERNPVSVYSPQASNVAKRGKKCDLIIMLAGVYHSPATIQELCKLDTPWAALVPVSIVQYLHERGPDREVDKDVFKKITAAKKIVHLAPEMCWIVSGTTLRDDIVVNAATSIFPSLAPVTYDGSITYAPDEEPLDVGSMNITPMVDADDALCEYASRPALRKFDILKFLHDRHIALCAALGVSAAVPPILQPRDHPSVAVAASDASPSSPGALHLRSFCGTVAEWVVAQKEIDTLKEYAKERDNYLSATNLLRYQPASTGQLLVVPTSFRKALTLQCHEDQHHMSQEYCAKHLMRCFHWPSLRVDVRRWVKACPVCERIEGQRNLAHARFRARPATAPGAHIGLDFKGMYPAATGENELLVALDLGTADLELVAQKGRTAALTLENFTDVTNRMGVPLIVQSDSAAEFTGRVVSKFCADNNIVQIFTRGYNARGNAQVERVMKWLNKVFRSLSDKEYSSWPKMLSTIRRVWVTHVNKSTGTTPFQATHGYSMRTPADARAPIADEEPEDPGPWDSTDVERVRQSAKLFRELCAQTFEATRQATAERLNASGTARTFKPGERVKFFKPPTAAEAKRRGRKIKHLAHYKPGTVIWRDPDHPQVYKIRDEEGTVYERTLINIAASHRDVDDDADESKQMDQGKRPAPTRERCPAETSVFMVGDIAAVIDHPSDQMFWFAQVTEVRDDAIDLWILGTSGKSLNAVKLKPMYSFYEQVKRNGKTVRLSRYTPNKMKFSKFEPVPWTYTLLASDLPDLVVARYLRCQPNGALMNRSKALLEELPNSLVHHHY